MIDIFLAIKYPARSSPFQRSYLDAVAVHVRGQPSYHAQAESHSDERAQAVLGTLKTAA
jgi:hypothetical protein